MLEFKFDKNYYGEGISRGIPRGIVPYFQGKSIVQEGMGIGSFAIQHNNRTYFCSIAKIDESAALSKTVDVEYTVDLKLEWTFLQKASSRLTTFLELVASKYYMKSEKIQNPMLKIGTLLRRLLAIEPEFKKVESLGTIKARYTIGEYDIHIEVCGDMRLEKYKLFVMNEIGGELFSRAIICGKATKPPTGWQKIENASTINAKTHILKSVNLGLIFYTEEISTPSNVESTLFWGREVSSGYNWAGFESELKCSSFRFEKYSYKVYFDPVK